MAENVATCRRGTAGITKKNPAQSPKNPRPCVAQGDSLQILFLSPTPASVSS
jgi:hypothetical protein